MTLTLFRSNRQVNVYDHFSLPHRQVIDTLPTGCQQVTDCWPTVDQHFGLKHNANCWQTVGRPSADCWLTVGQQSAHSRPTVGPQSADCWPTVGQQYILGTILHYYPTGERQTSWLFTSVAEKFNSELPRTTSASGQNGI